MISPKEQFSKFQSHNRWQKFVYFPLIRILIAVLFLIPVIIFHNIIIAHAKEIFMDSSYEWFKSIYWIVDVLIFMLAYRLYTKYIEKRPATEFSTPRAQKELGIGVAIGAILISVTVGIMVLAECYTIDSFGSWTTFMPLFGQFGVDTFLEELIFRIIAFRLIEEWLGSLWGFVIACLIFSLAHMENPNYTVWTMVSMSSLGMLLTASYMLTRRIWLAWGVHFGWNYFQTAVFGMANSGVTDHTTFITPRITGPEWLTGGLFGIEASWAAFAITTIVAILIIRTAIKQDQIIKPKWLRSSV